MHSAAATCDFARPGSLGRAPGGGGVRPVIRSGSSGYQARRDPLCQLLRTVVADKERAGRGAADGVSSVECRAVVTLYSLLLDHRIDQWVVVGPAAVLGRCSGRGGVPARCAARRVSAWTGLMRCCCWICWPTSEGWPPRHHPIRPPSHYRPRLSRPRLPTGPLGRGSRTQITVGPGMIPRWPPASPWPTQLMCHRAGRRSSWA